MTAIAVEKNAAEKREKRARSIAAMGLVNRDGGRFLVSTPSLRGRQSSYEVRRDEQGRIRCNCLEFEEAAVTEPGFRCEHILAVKFALQTKNTEPSARQANEAESAPAPAVSNDSGITESSTGQAETNDGAEQRETGAASEVPIADAVSGDGEQKTAGRRADVARNGQRPTVEAAVRQLANKKGERKMSQEQFIETAVPEISVEPHQPGNVLDFTSTLKELRKNVEPHLVKQREGWRDRNGQAHYVDYVEWHTVADILDEHAPNWSHTVKDMRAIGEIFTVTVAITIDGVTREGIGTGVADSELGIKKAEHDALKRAAVKFGIARELYKRESDVIERDGSLPQPPDNNGGGGHPSNPVARSLSDLVTAKQLGMIRALGRELNVDPDVECDAVMHCKTDELSKKAASSLIERLQGMQSRGRETNADSQSMRRVG